jgi:hypothetical protein
MQLARLLINTNHDLIYSELAQLQFLFCFYKYQRCHINTVYTSFQAINLDGHSCDAAKAKYLLSELRSADLGFADKVIIFLKKLENSLDGDEKRVPVI